MSGVKLPANVSKVGAGYVTAHERAALVAVMPYALDGIYDDNSKIEVFTVYNLWREARDKAIHTEGTVGDLTVARERAQKKIMEVFPVRNKQGDTWTFPKFHNMRYYEVWIRRVGPIKKLSTSGGERTHKDVKKGKLLTNSRPDDFTRQLLENCRAQSGLSICSTAPPSKRIKTTGTGVTQRAMRSKQIEVQFGYEKVSYPSFLQTHLGTPLEMNLLNSQPELKHFEQALRSMLGGYPLGSFSVQSHRCTLPHTYRERIFLHKALSVPCADEARRVCASPTFNKGAGAFDDVKVRARHGEAFMHVRTIFSYMHASEHTTHYALFGRLYESAGVWTATHSELLKWKKVSAPCRTRQIKEIYECVPLGDCLHERVVIIPRFHGPPENFVLLRNW
ncbi:hypothetical protein CYMTET_11821 [Cymbomonas tetramitiformis]|uniref:Uncharacterized protein n=1 Tax=Cymbomonas tetramitiformis TaxID=36881 RepID=A0AAE0GLB4_9CHLO|nr:hypothetical protein CYMTET_11821 [Cymbomonas tetramitiformis]